MCHLFEASNVLSSYVFAHFTIFSTMLETIVKTTGFIRCVSECLWCTEKTDYNEKTRKQTGVYLNNWSK